MDARTVFGMIVMGICCFGCGALFLGLGIHMQRSEKAAGFWAGKEVKAEWIRDLYAYNQENGRMWKLYSIPYFLSGVLGCLYWLHEGFMIGAVIILVLAAFPGIWLMIRQYRKIEKKYMNAKRLDKYDPFC